MQDGERVECRRYGPRSAHTRLSHLRHHAEQLLKHLDDPAADVATLCDQAEQSAALARAELEDLTGVRMTEGTAA